MSFDPYEGYEPDVLADTDHADAFLDINGIEPTPLTSYGFLDVEVLPILREKPWNNAALNLVMGLRPSSIRATTGEMTRNSEVGRVTVHLCPDGRTIKAVTQEMRVGLEGCRNGWDLENYFKGLPPVPASADGITYVINPKGLGVSR